MECFIGLAKAISHADDTMRYCYVTNVKSTTFLAFTLMKLQSVWTGVLENDRTQAVEASMQPTGGAAALASAWNFQYKIDSENKDTQCGQWQTLVTSDQTQIGNDTDDRKANFSLANGMAAALATINGLEISIN